MCDSFEVFDRCQECNKIWNIDFQTVLCYEQDCGLAEPAVIEPLVHHDLCALCKKLNVEIWDKEHGKHNKTLEPLVWESDSNSFSCIWTAPR